MEGRSYTDDGSMQVPGPMQLAYCGHAWPVAAGNEGRGDGSFEPLEEVTDADITRIVEDELRRNPVVYGRLAEI